MKSLREGWRTTGVQEKLHILIQGTLIVLFFVLMEWLLVRFDAQIDRAAEMRAEETANGLINGMNMLMLTGQISDPYNRKLLLEKMSQSRGIVELRIVRGRAVVEQFGPGLPEEAPVDDMDREVLSTGKILFRENTDANGRPTLRVVVPFIAKEDFRGTNCLQCHITSAGSVNGAASVTIDLSEELMQLREIEDWLWIGHIAVQLVLLVIITLFVRMVIVRNITRPIRNLQNAMAEIQRDMNLSRRADVDPNNPDIGEMATNFNLLVEKLEHANERLQLFVKMFDNSGEAIVITDAQQKIIAVNPAFYAITQYAEEEVIGRNPSILSSGRQDDKFYQAMWRAINDTGMWQGEIWNRRKNGEAYLEYLTISAVPGEDSKPSRYVSVFHDITESRRKDEHIRHLAFHDPLTGLPNRALFLDRLRHAIGRARRNGGSLAVTFIDLDGFKSVNDSLGHNVGDELLKEVATRIRARLRRDVDTVARLGGDEFVILMEELRETGHCASLADEIIADIGKPVEVCGHVMRVGASMGMAFFPEDGDDALELMQRADTAMYAAKAAGKGSYRFFQSAMLEEVNRRLDMETALRAAVDAGELVLHYQPKVCLTDGRLLGVEALVRWNHPQRGQLLPDEFISMAEETGIIDRLGHWVLGEACRQAAVWRDGGTIIPIAVNVSARQLGSDGLVDTVAGLLAQHRLPGMALQIELTETALMANPHRATAVLGRLRDMGLAIAIDDFGTGYSSLSRLRQLPIDLIKIDRGFVANSDHDEKDARMVRIVVAMGQALGLDVVAEGVESETQASLLKDSGCIACQGFLFAEPKPADLLDGWLAQVGNR
jgi:diguanylate cyclase (GGDEF)-like protein/PAS domain S-box-containing protein